MKFVTKVKPVELIVNQVLPGKGKPSAVDKPRLCLLNEFLVDVFVHLVEPKLASSCLLFDGLLSRNECLHSLTLVAAVCYAKLAQTTNNLFEKTQSYSVVTTLLTYILADTE